VEKRSSIEQSSWIRKEGSGAGTGSADADTDVRRERKFSFSSVSSFSIVFPFVRPSVSVVVVQVVRRSAVSVHRFTVSEARERESCPPFRENEEYAEENREIEANSKERYRRKKEEPAVRVRLNSQMNPVEFLNGCRPADFEKVLFACCLNT